MSTPMPRILRIIKLEMNQFGGFDSLQEETSYNKTVFAMMYLLQRLVAANLKAVLQQSTSDLALFKKIFRKMNELEAKKSTQPKFTVSLKKLTSSLKIGTPAGERPTKDSNS